MPNHIKPALAHISNKATKLRAIQRHPQGMCVVPDTPHVLPKIDGMQIAAVEPWTRLYSKIKYDVSQIARTIAHLSLPVRARSGKIVPQSPLRALLFTLIDEQLALQWRSEFRGPSHARSC
uniref:Uncharacterized protein n=1 Tax=Trichogramma kaykai TaxID=54128 RepID=A0ABD2VSV0_9HYME